jgi:DNA-directed RNA polymerase II subunit RPB1
VLRGLSNETVQFLGLNLMWSRPEWLVITVFPVAPPHVRPSVIMEGAASSDDDLTHMYVPGPL